MRRLTLVLTVLVSIAALAADRQLIKGELTLGGGDFRGTVLECGTNRAVEVGVMASAPYSHYAHQFNELSADGQFQVLVEISGELRRATSSSRRLVLESPQIVGMTRGSCDVATPNTSFERTREG
jgi:hypothetical protein